VLDREVHIVSIKESRQEADAMSDRAARLFRNHGMLDEWVVGSATRPLLDACPVPIFVHH